MDVLLFVHVSSVLALGGFTLATDYFMSDTELNWSEANDYCREKNGNLITLSNEKDWTDFSSEVCQSTCSDDYWTALQLDSKFGCEHDGKWIYDGWAKWPSREPNHCPQHACVIANKNEMRTRSCCDQNKALCRKDVTANSTNSSPAPVHICTQSTTLVTSDFKTTTQSTLLAVLTTGSPKMFTDGVRATPYNNTLVVDGSCEECCIKPNKSSQLSHEELISIIRDLKYQLAVNKTNLSANRRKLISVYDSRPSSVAMGGVAVAILVAFVAIIVVPDMVKLTRFQNKRQMKGVPYTGH